MESKTLRELVLDLSGFIQTVKDCAKLDGQKMACEAMLNRIDRELANPPCPAPLGEDEAVEIMVRGYVDAVHEPGDAEELELAMQEVRTDLGNAFAIGLRALKAPLGEQL